MSIKQETPMSDVDQIATDSAINHNNIANPLKTDGGYEPRWMWEHEYLLDRFHVAGFQHHDGVGLLSSLVRGDELCLVHQRDNAFDTNAVLILLDETELGFVPRERNQILARLLDQGAPVGCRLVQVNRNSVSWEAIEVEVYLSSGRQIQVGWDVDDGSIYECHSPETHVDGNDT
jgi:HIRAN domain